MCGHAINANAIIISKGHVVKTTLGSLPVINTVFESVCVDIIGAISPASDRGHIDFN